MDNIVDVYTDQLSLDGYGDFIKCCNCGKLELVETGATLCQNCGSEDLQWKNDSCQECSMDDLEGMGYIIQEHISTN